MKKFIFTAIIAIAGWYGAQAQSLPAPEKYNDYIEQVAALDPVTAEFLMDATMETLATDPKGYRQMMELAERRFSNPADPIHNESLYMVVLKHATEKFVLSNAEKEKQRLLLEGAKKNMIGSIAADFDYITPNDKNVHHLKDLKANNILVYFNNPDCESCEAVKERLSNNELINQLVNDKKLIVLAIYPYDDQKLWKKTKYPKMMINGWNQSHNIEYGELYDLPTLPCFYLLDKDYRVIIKNEGSLNKVEAKLKELMTAQETGPAPAPASVESLQKNDVAQAEAPQPKSEEKLPIKKLDRPKPVVIPAPADDPNTARSEQIMEYVLNNQGEEIYNSLNEESKAKAQRAMFDGILEQIESRAGKYQSHEPWEIRQTDKMKAYTSIMTFENVKLAMVIAYDDEGKISGMNFVDAQALRH